MRKFRKRNTEKVRDPSLFFDPSLLLPILFLLVFGLIMVYSASSMYAFERFGTGYFFLRKQAVYCIIGLMVLFGCRYVPLETLRVCVYPFLGISIILLIVVLVCDCAVSAGGATRWISLGFISFQPMEFTRFSMILYLAYSLEKKKECAGNFYVGFLPHIIVLGLFTILILMQPDFGAVAILGALTWIMMFVGGVRVKYLIMTFLLLILPFTRLLIAEPYRWKRIIAFLDPWKHANDSAFQIVHSLLAFGSGGVWGSGIGKGVQKLFYLPESHTDFILSIIGEEFGLVGVFFVIGMFLIIFIKGVRISMQTDDFFASYLAFGLSVSIGLQACINICVALSLMPTTGLTLPFLSYGGTSLIVNLASIGFIMNVGARVRGGNGNAAD